MGLPDSPRRADQRRGVDPLIPRASHLVPGAVHSVPDEFPLRAVRLGGKKVKKIGRVPRPRGREAQLRQNWSEEARGIGKGLRRSRPARREPTAGAPWVPKQTILARAPPAGARAVLLDDGCRPAVARLAVRFLDRLGGRGALVDRLEIFVRVAAAPAPHGQPEHYHQLAQAL